MALVITVFSQVSSKEPHPYVTGSVTEGYKLVGVGAFDNYGTGLGNMLTAMYLDSFAQDFVAAGKDHEHASPATLTAYGIGLYDPDDEWDVLVVSATSGKAAHPTATATLPSGYVLTGGGAVVNYTGAGNILTASFPSSYSTWEARSKDHDVSDPATITAFAIGIRSKIGREVVGYIATAAITKAVPHPSMQIDLPSGFTLTGGGALDNWTGAGNLLTASYPLGNGWVGKGKDHIEASPATIAVYAVGIRAM